MRGARGFIVLAALYFVSCTPQHAADLPISHLILHRGNYSIFPGNTLEGIQNGIAMGYPYIEIDVRKNGDGTYFLFHDNTIHTNNSIAPSGLLGKPSESLSREGLRNLCSPRDSSHCAAIFEDVIAFAKGKPVQFFLDIQNISPVRINNLVQFLEAHDFISQVVFQCPTPSYSRLVRLLDPSAKVLIRVYHKEDIALAVKEHPFAVQVDIPFLTDGNVAAIKGGGALVVTKTLDSSFETPQGLKEILKRGADLVLTDMHL